MDVGKGVSNHYKPEFEFSNFISFIYLFCAYIIVWKKILKNPIPPPPLPPFWVFSLIIHSLCFIRSFIIERQLHLELFLNRPIPTLFAELGWLHWDCVCSHCPYVLFEYYWVWLWIFDMLIMITFLCIYGYLTWFWTHECILTIFRQVIFVDICGYLCVNSFETCGSVLVICAGATNVFPKIYLQIL